MITLTKKFRFEAAHALLNYDGLCKNIHGHSYVLEVTIQGNVEQQSGMVMDFKILKQIVETHFLLKADHALFLNKNNPKSEIMNAYKGKMFLMESEPTAENIIQLIADSLLGHFPPGNKIIKIKLFETNSSWVVWQPD